MFPGKRLRVFKKPARDYKPEDDAVVTLSALRTLLMKGIVDIHNQSKDDRSGQIRIERYREAARIDPPRLVPDHSDIVELVGCQAFRKATRKGVVIFGMFYNSNELARYRNDFKNDPTVEVRYSPDDIGSVLVLDRPRGVSIRVPCVLRDYATGLTLHQHRVIRRHAIDRVATGRIYRHQLELAKADLYRIGKEMFSARKGRKLRQRMAHFFGASPDEIERVKAKRIDPSVSVPLLAKEEEDEFGKGGILDVEPDVADPTSDRSAEIIAMAQSLASDEDREPAPRAVRRKSAKARAPARTADADALPGGAPPTAPLQAPDPVEPPPAPSAPKPDVQPPAPVASPRQSQLRPRVIHWRKK